MLKFLKNHKFTSLLISVIGLLLVGVIAGTTAWYKISTDITPNVTSGIILSYFDSLDGATGDPGSSTNPYVITRPVHYYNLVKLMENEYDGFNGNNTYFQFGKDLDNSGTNKFYAYGDDGKQIASTYSTSLNMKYYNNLNGATRALSPLGSSSHPFLGNIEGNNLTVDKLYITGKDKNDIGIFGYVGTGAQIQNLYFDHVTIDLNVMNVSEVNATGHSTHSSNVNFGYIAGHIYDTDNFDNVYVNNVSLTNSVSPIGANVKSNFGYFGYCDNAQLPQYGEQAYRHSWDAADVYNYFDHNYSSISGMTLKSRNTEYTASGSVSTAISHSGSSSSEHYSFNNSDNKAYSLATAGYQKGDQTYNVQYFNDSSSSYSSLTGASVTNTSPASQTEEGYYVYYDASHTQWNYYTVSKTGGETVTKTYYVYSLSYKGVYNATESTTYYLYYNSSTNELDKTTTAPSSYASTPQYYFAFLRSLSDTGMPKIEDGNGTTDSYYIYVPSAQKFMYQSKDQDIATRTTLKFSDYETASLSSNVNQFTISGANNANISYTVTGGICYVCGDIQNKDDSPKGGATNGQRPMLSFTLQGTSQSSRTEENGHVYEQIDSLSDLSNGDVVALMYINTTDLSSSKAMAGQNNNNRASTAITFVTANDDSQVVYDGAIAEFILDSTTKSGYYRLHSSTPDGYLCYPGSNNYLRTTGYGAASSISHTADEAYWELSDYSYSGQYRLQICNYDTSTRYIQYNHSANLFSCYTNSTDNGSYSSPVPYKRIPKTVTIYGQNGYQISASSTSDEEIVLNTYNIYYYDPVIGLSDRKLFQIEPSLINSWSLSGAVTTVNLAPESMNGWNIVTGSGGLIVGEKYIIASNTNSKIAYGYDSSNNCINGVSATFNGDKTKITEIPNGAYQFVLGGNSTDGYTLTCEDGMLYGAATSVNFAGNNGSNRWSITIGASNSAVINCMDGYNIKYNSTGSRFNNYASGTAVQLYRKDTSDPEYIGDKIGGGYSPDYIDTVGSVDYYANKMVASNSSVSALSNVYIDHKFYNTELVDNAVIIRIPNRGSLDYGTLTITTGNISPVFYKSEDTVSMSDVSCSGVAGANNTQTFTLYLNKYNIYTLSYCTLDSSGNIIGAYNADGTQDFMKASSSIDEFVLVIGAPTSSSLEVSHIDIAFSELVGNIGDFGRVGFRNSPNTVPGEIISFTYEFASNFGSVSNSVVYNSSTDTYEITFASNVATTLYVYNYDANRAHVTVNGTPYVGPYNKINIAAS